MDNDDDVMISTLVRHLCLVPVTKWLPSHIPSQSAGEEDGGAIAKHLRSDQTLTLSTFPQQNPDAFGFHP